MHEIEDFFLLQMYILFSQVQLLYFFEDVKLNFPE